MQLTFEQYQKVREHDNENEEKNEDDNNDEKLPDKSEDDDQDMQGEILPEPDSRNDEPRTRREAPSNTRQCVFTKKRVMMKSPKRPITPVKIQ